MTRPPSTVCKLLEPSGHCRRRAGWLTAPSSTCVTTDRSTNTADTTTLGELLHGRCKWISGVAADNSYGIPCNSPSILIVDPAASAADTTMLEFHHCDGLDVSIPLFSMVTFIHSHRSSDAAPSVLALDAMRNHLPKLHNGRDIVLVCACRWFAEERMGREGKVGYDPSCKQAEEEFNKYTYTALALETKFGLIIMAAGAIPVIVVDHYVLPYQDLLDWETFSIRIPEHRLLELPRILRSIPDEVVEMMQRRVVFVFEEFFKSLSTQVHTALESARINLFSGDNAWQRALNQQLSPPPPPSTNHHCSGGMNRRALPCNDHPATLPSQQQQQQQQPTHPPPPMQQQQRMHHHHHLQLNTFPSQPNQPTNQPIARRCWQKLAVYSWEQVATAQVAFSAGSSSSR
ncbi:hypothetical protein PTSG_06425 [Salpingoeca rosetta]|uniref:Exostosin GT47 domain-containing protein n=1 Tax=Salpingoeca rosetta (strain ATCC 50818 / BSB-021) TaxID=946362 RepID=F2UFS1_SALR5|nr:uncharacterized protein PTSG_06425 [Salpingoeca rosetta]EGD75349.1 hypothetical protein PTSG_06425 [Salpingoeca rosetta]|eukprot:XP_004991806.1 hypothetical protein PTSG_06425 [Salpingoeca rosetta]